MSGYTFKVDNSPSPIEPRLKWRWKALTADGALNCTGWQKTRREAEDAARAHIRQLVKLGGGNALKSYANADQRKRGHLKGIKTRQRQPAR